MKQRLTKYVNDGRTARSGQSGVAGDEEGSVGRLNLGVRASDALGDSVGNIVEGRRVDVRREEEIVPSTRDGGCQNELRAG